MRILPGLLASLLHNFPTRVLIDAFASNKFHFNAGVPQGFVPFSLLFLAFRVEPPDLAWKFPHTTHSEIRSCSWATKMCPKSPTHSSISVMGAN